jgi:hypothetical protein
VHNIAWNISKAKSYAYDSYTEKELVSKFMDGLNVYKAIIQLKKM